MYESYVQILGQYVTWRTNCHKESMLRISVESTEAALTLRLPGKVIGLCVEEFAETPLTPRFAKWIARKGGTRK